MSEKDALNRIAGTEFNLQGIIGKYINNVTEQWLKIAPYANPAILEMFRDRDRKPSRNLLMWSGEFAGKYLTGAVQVYRIFKDRGLKSVIDDFVSQLISCQDSDGYLGPYPKEHHLTGYAPNVGENGCGTWDAWGHYHAMMGLMLYHEETGDAKSLACFKKIADLFCRKFPEDGPRLVDTGCSEMNLAPVHSLCLLYRKTGKRDYLALAQRIAENFSAQDEQGPLAGDYLRTALNGLEFYQTPRPRWESLHPIMGLVELYRITGEDNFRRAFEHIWWSIVKLDRHNNGGFSSGEQAQGNPYHPGAIETCCTIAWLAMSVEMLQLTGNSIVADEIELSTLNSVTGMHSSSGRWVTYDTPMDGVRRASQHSIVFQARDGSPELNCCSVNGARGFGMISDWALMTDGEGITVNYYGPSSMKTKISSGLNISLVQETQYPVSGKVVIKITPSKKQEFPIKLRIPHWSKRSRVAVNGKKQKGVIQGAYCEITREWRRGDTIEINLDMSHHFWAGEKECAGKVSVFRGPVLLTYDRRFNDIDPDDIPELDAKNMRPGPVSWKGWLPPLFLHEYKGIDGRIIRLCDFGSAGEGGSPYLSWLKIRNAPASEFSVSNPLRSGR